MKEAIALTKIRSKLLGGEWEIDHIIPLRAKLVCGLHIGINIEVVPRQFNRSKNNKINSKQLEAKLSWLHG